MNAIKKYILILSITLIGTFAHAQSLIENVIVETYYISDSLDATDTTGGRDTIGARILPKGSITYRVFVDLVPGAKIKSIYADANHALKIVSDSVFFNYDTISYTASANSNFGYQINKFWLPSDPLLALDSWLTIGLATKTNAGILKSEDPDGGSLLNNTGGSANIAGGLLANNDVAAGGIKLTTADGLVTKNTAPLNWFNNGFLDLSQNNLDTTIFGPLKIDSLFFSNDAILQQKNGTTGPTPDNKVLVAQLTTQGKIRFELNLEVMDSTVGGSGNTIKYVARKGADSATVQLSRYLKYPPDTLVCGCRDANYLEYNSAYGCDRAGACITPIVMGCMDPMACNYDPKANFNVASLCCYPGYCNNRDISLVCPGISNVSGFTLFPNPAQDHITLHISTGGSAEIKYSLFDSFGILIFEKNMGLLSGNIDEQVNTSNFNTGLYMVRVSIGNSIESKLFMKN